MSARGVPLRALGYYRGGLRSLILAAKHRGAHAAIRRLGGALRELSIPFSGAVAIPIPSSASGLLARGFAPSLTVARATELPVVDCLTMADARTQRGRDRRERHTRRIEVSPQRPVAGTRAVLVDDVVTTGASVNAATEACWRVGIRVVGVVTLAIATTPDRGVAALPNSTARV